MRQAAINLFKWLVRNWIEIPDSFVLWSRSALKLVAERLEKERFDVVVTTLPPFSGARIGYRLKKDYNIPWVMDYRDLWYGDVLREWIGPVRRRLELRSERRYARTCDAIVGVSAEKTEFLRELHPRSPARFETITNGYDPEIYEPFLGEPRVPDETIDFVFTGRLFKNRRGYAFAEALGRLAEDDPSLRRRVRVHMLGGVSAEILGRYEEIIEQYRLHDVFIFRGDVPYHEAMRAQVQCDYLLLIVDTGTTSAGVIPGKLFEYVAARRPIFALTDPGATQAIIERGKLGSVVPAESVEQCKDALALWLKREVPETLEADWDYLSQFERRRLSERFLRLLQDVVAGARSADA